MASLVGLIGFGTLLVVVVCLEFLRGVHRPKTLRR